VNTQKKEALPKYYEFFNSVKIVSGYKALESMSSELDLLGAKIPIIITDKGVTKAGLVDNVINSFGGTNIKIGAIYDDTPIDSSNVAVNEIAEIFRQQQCDSIIAVGGGSVIDTAKGVNIVISEETDDLMKFTGNNRLTKPMQPFIVVPTTAGTGSEVTMAAVIANPAKNLKMQFTSPLMLPKVAVLDPIMTMSMPPKITAATAMDALTHAVEAFIGPQKNPVSDAFAFSAIEMINEHIETAVKNGSDKDIRLAMANAALLAGVAFANSMCGIVHALAHATGALCHVPHGVANAILLPHGLEFYIKKSPETAERIGKLLRFFAAPEDYAKVSVGERSKSTVAAIRSINGKLNELCGIPLTLSQAGVTKDKLEAIAQATINDGAISFSPVDVSYQEALEVLRLAF
jgi:alcohol dehydrogenase